MGKINFINLFECSKKKMILVILVIFPISGNKWKNFFYYNEKQILCRKIEFWATAQVYCKARQLGWALG